MTFNHIFAKFLMIFQSGVHHRHCKTLKNHDKNLAQSEEKPCSTCLEPIFRRPFYNHRNYY